MPNSKQADAICAAAEAEAAAIERPSDPRQAAADTATWLAASLSVLKDGIKDLRSFTPPRTDEATISGLLELGDAEVTQLERARDAAVRNDQQDYDAAAAAAVLADDEANRIASSYGIDVCGGADEPATSTAPSKSSTDDAAKDVHITSCGSTDSGNLPEVKGTVVNSTSQLASYDIYVTFLDASDRQIGSGIEFVSNVAPGTALWDSTAAQDYQPGISCKISKVIRTASE